MRASDALGGWMTLPADCVALDFAPHAVERACERLCPGLAEREVRRRLSALLSTAVVTRTRPAWMPEEDVRATAYLVMGDVCMPLRPGPRGALVAATVLTRGSLGPGRRERQSAFKRKQRAGRAAKRRATVWGKGRPRHVPDPNEWAP